MTLQFQLDFSEKLPIRAQEGMAKCDENADETWKHIWDGCVLAVAKKQEYLTSDDVLAEFESLKLQPVTHNISAIGPAMRRAQEMNILEPTEKVERSKRPEKNGNLHRVWLSKYWSPF